MPQPAEPEEGDSPGGAAYPGGGGGILRDDSATSGTPTSPPINVAALPPQPGSPGSPASSPGAGAAALPPSGPAAGGLPEGVRKVGLPSSPDQGPKAKSPSPDHDREVAEVMHRPRRGTQYEQHYGADPSVNRLKAVLGGQNQAGMADTVPSGAAGLATTPGGSPVDSASWGAGDAAPGPGGSPASQGYGYFGASARDDGAEEGEEEEEEGEEGFYRDSGDPTYEPEGDGAFGGAGRAIFSAQLHAAQGIADDELEDELEHGAALVARTADEPDMNYDALIFSPWERVRAKKSRRAKMFLAEALLYLVFVTAFSLYAHTFRSRWTFWMGESIRENFVDPYKHALTDIYSTETFYDWAEHTLFPGLGEPRWYNGDRKNPWEQKYAVWQNRIVGYVRMRQLRIMQNGDCFIRGSAKAGGQGYSALVHDCYPPWDATLEETRTYGPPWNTSRYVWQSKDQICQVSNLRLGKLQDDQYCKAFAAGRMKDVYPASGYSEDFTTNNTGNMERIRELRNGQWIDAQTRAVIIDFTLFNTNVRLLVSTQIIVEWFATGLVVARASIKPIPAMASETFKEILGLIVEALLAFCLALFFAHKYTTFMGYKRTLHENCIVCRRLSILRTGDEKKYFCNECDFPFNPFRSATCVKCQMEYSLSQHICWIGFFQDLWNIVDLVNLTLFMGAFSLRFALRRDITVLDVSDEQRFILMYPLAYQYMNADYVNAFNALIVFLRSFKYLRVWPKVATLVSTLSSAVWDILGFLIMYGMLFLGFGLAFNLVFSSDLYGYMTIGGSLMRVFALFRGDIDYEMLEGSNRVLAPLYMMMISISILLIGNPIALAIVQRAYHLSPERVIRSRDAFSLSALLLLYNGLKVRVNRVLGRKTPVTLIYILLENLEAVPDLTRRQRDDIRTFRNEVEHAPDDNDLFNDVLRAFDRKINRTMTVRDFETLRDTLHSAKYRKTKSKKGGLDDSDGEISDETEEPESPKGPKPSDAGEVEQVAYGVEKAESESSSDGGKGEKEEDASPQQQLRKTTLFAKRAQWKMNENKLQTIEETMLRMSGQVQELLELIADQQAEQGPGPSPRDGRASALARGNSGQHLDAGRLSRQSSRPSSARSGRDRPPSRSFGDALARMGSHDAGWYKGEGKGKGPV